MGSKRRRAQRCTANCADGTRCGKWCAEGQTVCALHQPNATPAGIIAQQDPGDDWAEILKRLMKDRDPQVRLRAIDLYVKHTSFDDGCDRCKHAAADDREREDLVSRLTPEQRAELSTLFVRVRALKNLALTQPVYIAPRPVPPPPPVLPAPVVIPTTDLSPTESEPEDDGIDWIPSGEDDDAGD